MIQQRLLSPLTHTQAIRGAILIGCALLFSSLAAAQAVPTPAQTNSDDDQAVPVPAPAAPVPPAPAPKPGPTVTIRILDSKTGTPINPSNLLIHVDHRDEPFNEGLKLHGTDPATAVLPAGATTFAVEGAYNASMDVYVNCDTDTGKDATGTLKWYSIADILKTGIVTDNLCYKSKYQHRLNISPVPGEFVFFVRTHNWHEQISE